jgi:hypothetical protein
MKPRALMEHCLQANPFIAAE